LSDRPPDAGKESPEMLSSRTEGAALGGHWRRSPYFPQKARIIGTLAAPLELNGIIDLNSLRMSPENQEVITGCEPRGETSLSSAGWDIVLSLSPSILHLEGVWSRGWVHAGAGGLFFPARGSLLPVRPQGTCPAACGAGEWPRSMGTHSYVRHF
jgi:hypothetical protein